MKLQGRVAVVTGAGSGIGRAVATRLAAEGARVVIAEIDEAKGEEAAEQIRGDGGDAIAIPTDVSRADSVAALFARLDELAMPPDVLVNNAGNASPPVPVHEMADEVWHTKLRVHLDGTFYNTREALRRMLPLGRGVIINVASVAGLRGLPGGAAYTAAKGGIIAFTKGVAVEVAEAGVRVVAIAPGWIDTPILANLPRSLKGEMLRRIPVGRLGTPEEVAAVVAFLASDDASYLTGQIISPNGGLYL
ncbi:SDR family NAD(P)-dependent oxidoreductase [Paludisphaera mucosa]|uniref:SDR family NAD(P)-dependent oxidoreductase n=1 Tax=Paludisphaera mucosa TaxID=3030827 RepID=A0ABT6FJ54_9BACT|nr:SDR family NAD(P)-dependent oxidoreductase [Paludisphaera mucosa]MDG3007612.1 SDR family NAD(P)-dependent oxidoreductase [Paludisphaera mucosa]